MRADFPIPKGLERLAIPAEAGELPVPQFIACFIRDAENRAEELGEQAGGGLFVPGDYRYAFQVLQWLMRAQRVRPGASFLEWGSGMGMVAIVASLLGFAAVGVEIDFALVKEARELAARYDASARFEHGSYDPGTAGLPVFSAAGQSVVYVYPWPGEESFFLQRFADSADAGTCLLMGLGPEDIRLFQRSAG